MDEELRSALRRKVLKGATISFGGGAISCLVRNLSDSGASLEVSSPMGVQNAFVLNLKAGTVTAA